MMDQPTSKKTYLDELKDFLTFLTNLWGILAGLSIFFPFSNKLLGAIPLQAYGTDGGVFDLLTPQLISTLATVVTLFVVLITFSTRTQKSDPRKKQIWFRKAWVSLGCSLLALLAYLTLHYVYREYAWGNWGWGSGDPRKLLAEIPLLGFYTIFFSLLTRSFMLLGMGEFFRGRPPRTSSK